MPTPQIPSVNDDAGIEELRDAFIGVNRYLTYLLSALDTLNISRLDAKVVVANTITADKMDVNELSAISANLGTIEAGNIYGTYIATSETTPKVEMSNTLDLLKASYSPTKYTELASTYSGNPALHFVDGSVEAALFLFGGSSPELTIISNEEISIRPGSGKLLNVPSWYQIYSEGSFQTLGSALSDIWSAISSLSARVSALESAPPPSG